MRSLRFLTILISFIHLDCLYHGKSRYWTEPRNTISRHGNTRIEGGYHRATQQNINIQWRKIIPRAKYNVGKKIHQILRPKIEFKRNLFNAKLKFKQDLFNAKRRIIKPIIDLKKKKINFLKNMIQHKLNFLSSIFG